MPAKKTVETEALDQLAAEVSEEAGELAETRTFEWKGVEFTAPGLLDMPLEVLELDESDDLNPVALVRLILGDEQWATFKATKPKVRDFHEFMSLLMGADSGK